MKQADVCSPVLLSLFINELAVEIINRGKHGSLLTQSLVELFIVRLLLSVCLCVKIVKCPQEHCHGWKSS